MILTRKMETCWKKYKKLEQEYGATSILILSPKKSHMCFCSVANFAISPEIWRLLETTEVIKCSQKPFKKVIFTAPGKRSDGCREVYLVKIRTTLKAQGRWKIGTTLSYKMPHIPQTFTSWVSCHLEKMVKKIPACCWILFHHSEIPGIFVFSHD